MNTDEPAAAAARLEAEIREATRAIPSFAAHVAIGGEPLLEINPDAPLCACSTIKVAVGAAVMKAAEDGRIDLDARVGELDGSIRFASPEGGSITLRMLMSHTSGLDDTDKVEDDPRAAATSLPFVAAPGRAFRYSNVAFDVGAEAAACAGGFSDAETMLGETVLSPLGMAATAPWPELGTGVMRTTARDLARLAEAQIEPRRLLSERSLAEMRRIHADSYTAAANRYYGLGISIERWGDGRETYSHGGGLGRYGSACVIDPETRSWAIFLFDHPAGYGVSPHIVLDRLLGRETTPPAPRPLAVDWRAYVGRYENGAQLKAENGRPVLNWKGAAHGLRDFDERLLAASPRISVGLLPGEPRMISVNDFILIGARPGRRIGD